MTDLRDSLVSNRPPFLSVIIILAVALMGFLVIGSMIGFMLAKPFYEGQDLLTDMMAGSLNENSSVALLILQGCVTFTGLIALPMLYIRFSEYRPISAFFKRESSFPFVIGFLFLILVTFVITISPITEWNQNLVFPEALKNVENHLRAEENRAAEMTAIITNFTSPGNFLLAILVIGVFAGVGEEFVFRGLIQNELYRGSGNIHLAIWASAFLFSAFHMQFFGFFPRLLLGALLGYLYFWSGNLWVPIITHFFNNALVLTVFYLQSLGEIEGNVDETSAPISLVAGCAVAVFTLLYFFKKHYSSVPQNP